MQNISDINLICLVRSISFSFVRLNTFKLNLFGVGCLPVDGPCLTFITITLCLETLTAALKGHASMTYNIIYVANTETW
jgi:hypothetical protein